VIRTPQESGRKLIYVNEPFTQHIIGMKKDESDALLNFLYAYAPKAEFQCRFR
jgi:taurine dioxygenase